MSAREKLTDAERRVLERLEQADREFAALDAPIKLEHMRMFAQAIEGAKAVLAARVIERLYPDGIL